MPDGDDALGVDILVGQEVIDGPAEAPGPDGDGAAVELLVKERADALADLRLVGIDVAVVERRQRVAAVDDVLDVPHLLLLAPAGGGGAVVLDAGVVGVDPRRRDTDLGVIDGGVVAAEVQPDEHRRGCRALVGHDEQQVNLRRLPGSDGQGDLLERGLASERLGVGVLDLGGDVLRRRRDLPVHVVLEELLQLGPALLLPVVGRLDPGAVEHHQRVGVVLHHGQLGGLGQVGGQQQAGEQGEGHGVAPCEELASFRLVGSILGLVYCPRA